MEINVSKKDSLPAYDSCMRVGIFGNVQETLCLIRGLVPKEGKATT